MNNNMLFSRRQRQHITALVLALHVLNPLVVSAQVILNANTLNNTAYGAIQTENMVVRAACFNCHQTVRYAASWGGVIESAGATTLRAQVINNRTTDTRDGFAGLSTDPRVVIVDERSGTQSPLTQAFVDRFGLVNGPASSSGNSRTTPQPAGTPLSDNLVLTAYGTFDFTRFKLPDGQSGLFQKAPASAPYLIQGRTDLIPRETGTQNTNYNQFLGSDYLLTRLGMLPGTAKRLGDAWYETQLVQEQLYALSGKRYVVANAGSDYELMRSLMDAGLLAQAQLSLSAGEPLSPAQQAALTQDMVWPEWQEVDGQRVLVPHVYLAKASVQAAAANAASTAGARIAGAQLSITTDELNNSGSLAASNSLAINASGKVSGGGNYSGGNTVAIVAGSVDLKHASLQSGGWLSIDSANDMTLTATQIKAAGDASLTAGGELSLKAQEFNTKVVRADGTSRSETKYETSNIDAGGTVVLSAKKDLTLEGSKVDAGNNLLVQSTQGNVNLVARKETSDYSYNGEGALAEIQAKAKAAQEAAQNRLASRFGGSSEPQAQTFAAEIITHTQVHEESLQNVRLTSKGNATVQANQGDIKATALDVNAGKDITLQAGGVVQLDALQANGGTLKAGNDVLINGGQVSLSHTAAQAGRDLGVQATDGGAVLKAVDMQAERNFELSSAGAVADGYSVGADGSTLISADGTRVFRPPASKPNTPAQFNPSGVQANFVTQTIDPNTGKATIVGNGHLVVLS